MLVVVLPTSSAETRFLLSLNEISLRVAPHPSHREREAEKFRRSQPQTPKQSLHWAARWDHSERLNSALPRDRVGLRLAVRRFAPPPSRAPSIPRADSALMGPGRGRADTRLRLHPFCL